MSGIPGGSELTGAKLDGWSFGNSLGCVLLLAATPPVTVWAIRSAKKIAHRQLPPPAALSLLAAAFAGVIVAMVLLRGDLGGRLPGRVQW